MPERPPDYVSGATRDPSQPTTSVGSATQSQSSESHAYGCVSSHSENCCKSLVTPRLPQTEDTGFALPLDSSHSATQSEYLTTSDTTHQGSVPEPMAVDQMENAPQVSPRHSHLGLVPPATTDTTDTTDPRVRGSFNPDA